jgi:hypothetical protein
LYPAIGGTENKEVFSGFDVFAPQMEYWNVEDPDFSPAFGGIDFKRNFLIY